jgi:hypothetical protein
MARMQLAGTEAPFFSLPQAKWVVGVLSMLIAVVRRESLLGLILRQARTDINGLVRAEESDVVLAAYRNN